MHKKLQIGIITHHYIKNYGAFLQAYALQQILMELFPDAVVEIVNYINVKHYFANLRPFLISKPQSKNFIKSIKIFFEKKNQMLQFHKAKHFLNLSNHCWDADDINKRKYDAIFIGSDEVWNINSTSLDKIKFAVDLSCPNLISYAPSVGSLSKVQELPTYVSKGIKKFNKISVRDIQTKNMVSRFYEGKVEMVLDPTFLYDFNMETKSIKGPITSPYILVYQCRLSAKQIKMLKNFAETKGLIIVGAGYHEDWFDRSLIGIAPFEWIELFNQSQYVVTGTFHGSIFAIKAKKKFIAVPTLNNRVEKIKSLLNLLGLEKQFVSKKERSNICDYMIQDIDYAMVYKRIDKLKQKSVMFLKESIVE